VRQICNNFDTISDISELYGKLVTSDGYALTEEGKKHIGVIIKIQ
jgi:hypothetical protein